MNDKFRRSPNNPTLGKFRYSRIVSYGAPLFTEVDELHKYAEVPHILTVT